MFIQHPTNAPKEQAKNEPTQLALKTHLFYLRNASQARLEVGQYSQLTDISVHEIDYLSDIFKVQIGYFEDENDTPTLTRSVSNGLLKPDHILVTGMLRHENATLVKAKVSSHFFKETLVEKMSLVQTSIPLIKCN